MVTRILNVQVQWGQGLSRETGRYSRQAGGGRRWVTWPCAVAVTHVRGTLYAPLSVVAQIHWWYYTHTHTRKRLASLDVKSGNITVNKNQRHTIILQYLNYLPRISSSSAIPLWCSVSKIKLKKSTKNNKQLALNIQLRSQVSEIYAHNPTITLHTTAGNRCTQHFN